MAEFLQTILTTSIHGSIVILAILLLRFILKKAPRKFICLLWMLAGIRLLLPVPLESAYSLQPESISITLPAVLSGKLSTVWIIMAVIIGLSSIVSYIHLRRKVRFAVKIPGGWEADGIETAFVLGFVKPKIYIPTGMPEQIRKQILEHERTHLDKGDHWIKMIGFLALALHWFNPLVWVSYILLCKDIEMACDERVVQFMELEERKAYSSALLRCSTNKAHYAACPVAFGEISVKYRIKSILRYRKPSFWLSLLALLALVFVAVCLMTSPRTTVEVPVDADVPLREISQEDPETFTPAILPETENNPDWGVDIFMDTAGTTGGTLVYEVEERFAAASPKITVKNPVLEKWNGTAWEAVPSLSGQTAFFDEFWVGFAQKREAKVEYLTKEVDWTLYYGQLGAGDYRICQTIESVTDSAVFCTPFHIYREALPSEEEDALTRCEAALSALANNPYYSVLISESAPDGQVYPVKGITTTGDALRIDHYLGEYLVSSSNAEDAVFYAEGWDTPFRVNQNRRFLFPEGKAVISQEEVTFFSVWADYKQTPHMGKDTFEFHQDGTLKSVERQMQTMDEAGNMVSEQILRLDVGLMEGYTNYAEYISEAGSYAIQDSFDGKEDSPWGIFFRVDDDLLAPGGGEIWLGTDAVGVSCYTADGSYWLEKKTGKTWKRLGEENTQASWGNEVIPLTARTALIQVDWSQTYGSLEAGVYRMGKHFYNGTESIIQYAEFAIYQTGGIYGDGGEEALARVDAAIEKLQSGNYRVEKYESYHSPYAQAMRMTSILWKYGDTMVRDYYNNVESYSHSAVSNIGDFDYGSWLERNHFASDYDSIYFPAGYGGISDSRITLAYAYGKDSADNPCRLYTYCFDEAGNLIEIQEESMDSMWNGYITRYVVTQTPEAEIRAWVEAKKAAQ